MPTNDEILAAILSTEPATFGEFCNDLPDCPVKGERAEWAELFRQLEGLEKQGLVEIERANRGGSIESLMLTGEGAARVKRAKLDRRLKDQEESYW